MKESRVWRGHLTVNLRGALVEVWYDVASGELDDWGFSDAACMTLPLTDEENEAISEQVWAESRL